jgi:hypothetical protein
MLEMRPWYLSPRTSHHIFRHDRLARRSVCVLDNLPERLGMPLGTDNDGSAPLNDPCLGLCNALERTPQGFYMLQT